MSARRFLGTLLVGATVFTAIHTTVNTQEEQHAERIPACKYEDGSTQKVCMWDGRKQGNGHGDVVINVDYGAYSYNLNKEQMEAY